MLIFNQVRNSHQSLLDFSGNLNRSDLRVLTNEMIDYQLELIADCRDEDVVMVPDDPLADDPFAENPEDVDLAWTLGHVIVHITASSEEAAAIAAELARGVLYHGRSRYEVPWQEIKTVAQCRQRLEESRRIRLASLEMWPENPDLDNFYKTSPGAPRLNATARFLYGLMHDDDHLEHISKIVRQAIAARKDQPD